MNKVLKIKYNKDFIKICILVNKFEQRKLIEAIVPADEYDSLTNKFFNRLHNKIPQDEIRFI